MISLQTLLNFFMRSKTKVIVIIIMMVCVVFIQCSKTFKKADEGTIEEFEQAVRNIEIKKPSGGNWWAF